MGRFDISTNPNTFFIRDGIFGMNALNILILSWMILTAGYTPAGQSYTVVDTGQIRCYSDTGETEYPKTGAAFFGQDAQYNGNQPAYKDNGDGTVTDLNTGLMWIQDPGSKKTFEQAAAGTSKCKIGGYTDWRLPTIKELYSLIQFSGTDPDPMSSSTSGLHPFIDTKYFKFQYGKAADGDRIIDSQFATSTIYRSTTMNGNNTMFGVNFADGRIKGYPAEANRGRPAKGFYILYVRGNQNYGKNQFVDNGDGTITDNATGLTWMKADSGKGMNWQAALKYAENLDYAGHDDWRLPNAKELQSIVDYTRCPDITNSAAIDPIFGVTPIENEGSQKDYPYYWTSTSHVNDRGSTGVYVAFGRALGFMDDRRTGRKQLMDVHGAGAQRSDPKTGKASQFPTGRGPQGDVIRIENYIRCVRGGAADPRVTGPKIELKQISRLSGGNLHQEPGGGKVPNGKDFVRRLDRNGDGKVSRQEFDGPPDQFDKLDRNRDGFLEENETPTRPRRN
jgi:hypothetical protein